MHDGTNVAIGDRGGVRLKQISSEHFVMLFDSTASRGSALATFMTQARASRRPLVVLAAGLHWEAAIAAAGPAAADFSRGLADGSIIYGDAEVAVADICRAGYPQRTLFEDRILSRVRSVRDGREVYVYGELVDILAGRGDFDAAVRLEQFWNDALAAIPIRLMCGYTATHFAAERTEGYLRGVCECHSSTRMSAGDTLGRWLLTEAAIPFDLESAAV